MVFEAHLREVEGFLVPKNLSGQLLRSHSRQERVPIRRSIAINTLVWVKASSGSDGRSKKNPHQVVSWWFSLRFSRGFFGGLFFWGFVLGFWGSPVGFWGSRYFDPPNGRGPFGLSLGASWGNLFRVAFGDGSLYSLG